MTKRHYDLFIDYREKGKDALRAKDDSAAIDLFLQAAWYATKSAENLDGKVRDERIKTARKLKEYALEIQSWENKSEKTVQEKKDSKKRRSPESETTAKKWIMTELPTTKLADVAGMDEVKEIIKNKIINPFQHPEIWAEFRLNLGGGVLLYGPPGNGKTFIASAIASEMDAAFFSVKVSDVMSKWVGETEQHLSELFAEAKSYERSVVFLDEIEALLAKRGSGSTVMDRAVPQFLEEIDGIVPRTNCLFLLGATNVPWMIDKAALRPKRFGKLIYVGLPDLAARKKIMEINLRDIPLDVDVDLSGLAKQAEGYSGADIAAICDEVKERAAMRKIDQKNKGIYDTNIRISSEDIQLALAAIKPSVSQKDLQKFEDFKNGKI